MGLNNYDQLYHRCLYGLKQDEAPSQTNFRTCWDLKNQLTHTSSGGTIFTDVCGTNGYGNAAAPGKPLAHLNLSGDVNLVKLVNSIGFRQLSQFVSASPLIHKRVNTSQPEQPLQMLQHPGQTKAKASWPHQSYSPEKSQAQLSTKSHSPFPTLALQINSTLPKLRLE